MKERLGGTSYTVNFKDETFNAKDISGTQILKGIKIDSAKVKTDYFVKALEKQGYRCEK